MACNRRSPFGSLQSATTREHKMHCPGDGLAVGMGKHTLVESALRPAVVSAGGWLLSHRYNDSQQQRFALGPVGETAEHRQRLLPKRYKFAELDQGIDAWIKVSNDVTKNSLKMALTPAFSCTANRDTMHEMLPLLALWLDSVDVHAAAAAVLHSDTRALLGTRSRF
jgi:hypothetical protein